MDVRAETVEAGGLRAHCRTAGAGEPLILLHGLGASSYSWRAVLPDLARDFSVWAPDLPGFGRTEKPDWFDYSPGGLSRWVVAFMERLGLASAHLAGNSMGGVISVWAALETPARVRSMALLGTPVYPHQKPPILWPMRWPVIGPIYERSIGPWAVGFIAKSVFIDRSVITKEMLAEYGAPLAEAGGRAAIARFIRNAIPPDLDAWLSRYRDIRQPTAVIVGDQDCMVDLAGARRFAAEVAGSLFTVIPNCGHAPQEERPAETLAALRGFLGGLKSQNRLGPQSAPA